jgi:hypothetical protein
VPDDYEDALTSVMADVGLFDFLGTNSVVQGTYMRAKARELGWLDTSRRHRALILSLQRAYSNILEEHTDQRS